MKAAIVGAGFMGSVHADAISKTDGQLDLAWIVDRDKHRGSSLARQHGAKWTDDVAMVLKDAGTEVVIHALPTVCRYEYLKKYMAAQKHILCEKPLALTMRDAEKIRTAARGCKKTFMVGHVLRFFWEYRKARDLILAGDIGKPGIARLSRISGPPASRVPEDNWYLDNKRSGGVILDLGIHDFDWLLWTFGAVKRGYAQNLGNKKTAGDYCLAILKFKCGVLAHVESSWMEAPGVFTTSFEVSGSGGLIEYDMKDARTLALMMKKGTGALKAGTSLPESPCLEDPYVAQMKHFAQCVIEGEKPLAGADEGFESVRLALDLSRSARTGQPVIY